MNQSRNIRTIALMAGMGAIAAGAVFFMAAAPALAQDTQPKHGLTTEFYADAVKQYFASQSRVAELAKSKDTMVENFLPTAEYLLVSLRNFLDPGPWEAANGQPLVDPDSEKRIAAKDGRAQFVKNILAELEIVLSELEAGRNPYVKHTGCTLIAYRSPLDGRLLAMRVTIPDGFDPARTYALNYSNSSSGGATGNVQRPLSVRWPGKGPKGDLISAVFSDRGECHYGNDIHEQESLESIAAMSRMFRIDPLRISKSGGSKDGYTSVSIGIHYPHLLAYTYGTCPNSLPEGTIDSKGLPIFAPFREQMNAYLMAENLYDLPSAMVTGFDGDHTNTVVMGALLDKIGAPDKIVRAEPEGGHGTTPWTAAEVDKWTADKKLGPYPQRVYVSTNSLRYNRFYWVEVDAIEHQNRFARMRVDVLAGNAIEVTAHNVERFTLVSLEKLIDAAKPVTVEINDIPLKDLAARDGRLSFAKKDGKWAATADRYEAGLVKKHGLCGPVMDGWIQPCVHVLGTLGGADETARLREMMETEVRFLRSESCGFRRIDHPVKLDTEITSADIRDRNLILWGNDRTNKIIKDINAKLPVRLDGSKVIVCAAEGDAAATRTYEFDDVALAMIYPNPLNPARYAMIFSGNTWMALDDIWVSQWGPDRAAKTVDFFKIGGGYPMLPDFMVFRQNRRGLIPRWGGSVDISVLEGGYFDGRWKLTDDDTFAWRNPTPQKNAPLSVPKAVRPRIPQSSLGVATSVPAQ
ncbi:MAG: hypothetical protein ACE15C_04650 [Phycisphaerae bacterium]